MTIFPARLLAATVLLALTQQVVEAADNSCHISGTQTCCPTVTGGTPWTPFDPGGGVLYRINYSSVLLQTLNSLHTADPAAYTALVTKLSQSADENAVLDNVGLEAKEGVVQQVADYEAKMATAQAGSEAQNLELISVYASLLSANTRGDLQLAPSQLDIVSRQLTTLNSLRLAPVN